MVKNSVACKMNAQEADEELIVHLRIAQSFASLDMRPAKTSSNHNSAPRGAVELPIDDSLGQDDPNLRILQAMQAAALTEIGRQMRSGRGQGVHVPEPLDLSDLKRFPGAAFQ